MRLIKWTFWILFFAISVITSQNQNFQVEYYSTEGELTEKDLVKKDFGRFDGFEIPLGKGEKVHFFVYSDNFNPHLVLISPSEETFIQSPDYGNDFAILETLITESGDWLLYILADSTDLGSYYFQYAFANPSSLTLDAEADFCTTLSFLLAHANANFIFLEKGTTEAPDVRLNGSTDVFIDGNDGSYNAVMYQGNNLKKAESLYDSLRSELKNCLANNWKMEGGNWKNIYDYRAKTTSFTEKIKSGGKYINVTISDYSDVHQKDQPKYSLDVIINKKNQ